MKTWPVQDEKARFSEFLQACIVDGPQMVSKRGAEAAVLFPWRSGDDFRQWHAHRMQLLLSDVGRSESLIPPWRVARKRNVADLAHFDVRFLNPFETTRD